MEVDLLYVDGQTDVTKQIVTFCNFANTPKNEQLHELIILKILCDTQMTSFIFVLIYKANIHSHTFILTLCSRVLLEKLIVPRLVGDKFPALFVNQRCNSFFTITHYWSLSHARWNKLSPSHHISWIFILILSSICLQVLQVISFLQVFPSEPCTHIFSSLCVTCLAHIFYSSHQQIWWRL